ncbi:P-loop containing nucleoside triphosphate hydrolase protein, partial [Mycena crocata]
LPSEPKIFHGRESELFNILQLFNLQTSPRIAILGPAGIGKTSLAQTVLHHQEITSRYAERRFFVPCDKSSNVELVGLLGAHLGLKPGQDLTTAVIYHLSTNPACLLILDNLETVWESEKTREDVEEFLCLLTDVEHLALVITMRGAKRPAKVRWSRPFLAPLKSLPHEAARQTFIDIA